MNFHLNAICKMIPDTKYRAIAYFINYLEKSGTFHLNAKHNM